MEIILSVISLCIGIVLFPILFYFQYVLKLSLPNLRNPKIYIHHSLYGVLFMLLGICLLSISSVGIYGLFFGLGLVIHHEISEPGLRGMAKFIYIKKKDKKEKPIYFSEV